MPPGGLGHLGKGQIAPEFTREMRPGEEMRPVMTEHEHGTTFLKVGCDRRHDVEFGGFTLRVAASGGSLFVNRSYSVAPRA